MLEPTSHDLVIARLLALLEDDWVPACALASFVYHSGVTAPPENRDVCLALVQEALESDLIRVGRLNPQFEAWETPVADVMSRLAGEWPRDAVPGLGDSPCWFDLTDTGRRRAAEFSQRFAIELKEKAGSYARVAIRKS
jgi:hypothetical protein